MLDFVSIKTKRNKNTIVVYPEFLVKPTQDVMFRGKAFYAIWDKTKGLWSTEEEDVQRLVDSMVFDYAKTINLKEDEDLDLRLLSNFSSNKWEEWKKYCKNRSDNYHLLDTKIAFTNTQIKKFDYISKMVPYEIKKQDISGYEKLISTLYSTKEREKIEWAIGSVITGDSKKIQKFLVFYGGPGTGKSTVLKIIERLFPGYTGVFDSKELGSNGSFALESFKDNPLVAIQHDGDLSRIEDNTKINSIVSHETMIVNEKYKSKYEMTFNAMLFMGTNKPVKITDAKSGIIRRLIDVTPTGNTLSKNEYDNLISRIQFELGGIANHCLSVYKKLGEKYYDNYIPTKMILETNEMYNFVEDNYDFFAFDNEDGVCLSTAWRRYKEYCTDSNVQYPYIRRIFRDELKEYFDDFKERYNGSRNVYIGFKKQKFDSVFMESGNEKKEDQTWLDFKEQESLFDDLFKDYPAQYANGDIPSVKWDDCETKLKDVDTKKLHYIKGPKNLITIDFDLKDENGNKSFELNKKAAEKWPKTYGELSKSGEGIHLHYYYAGDPLELSNVYDKDIEVKVFRGNSSLRRKLTKCNNTAIAIIEAGMLVVKEVKNVINDFSLKNEQQLRNRIEKNLRKEVHNDTRSSIDFIYKILEDAYHQKDFHYDVSDMRPAVQYLALHSTHQASYCVGLVSKMKFKSDEPSKDNPFNSNDPIVFFDVEVFPNLFVIVWKKAGKECKKVNMVNPKPEEVEDLFKYKLVGFNNRDYDNHILYAASMGYSNKELYLKSKSIINGEKYAKFGEAYNLSYTDIYDFLSAIHKMSLKKWEIKLHIHHLELGLPWDEPVPEELWPKVVEYCGNDVDSTEAVWDANQADWKARKILAELSGLTVNDKTNSHTERIIFGDDKNPQSSFVYTDLGTIFPGYQFNPFGIDRSLYNEGTKIVQGKSIYMGEDPSEGGYAFGNPGMYINVALLDVESMHPHSAISLNIFGDKHTKRFNDLIKVRLLIKHGRYDGVRTMLDGVLAKFLDNEDDAKALADALKTAIVSVYGLTSASFPNAFRDPRNKDNIVAKYGSLFMITLKHEVEKRGYTVVHIKTDSIKIANATPEIISFVKDFGKKYGYNFDHEATYSKMCIVNDSVYIARYDKPKIDKNTGKEIWWTATGTQFQVPYVFKKLFSKEPIEFYDLCETKSVTTALYLDMNEGLPDLPFDDEGEFIPEDHPSRHNYRFVGKIGSFCPIKPGCGGGVLLRQNGDKFSAVTGTKKPGGKDVYRWLESEVVIANKKEDDIDYSYYDYLVDKAVDEINKYGDIEWFRSDDTCMAEWMNVPETENEELPFL